MQSRKKVVSWKAQVFQRDLPRSVKAIVKLNVSMKLDVPVKNPAGQIEPVLVVLADIIKDFVLSDDRFGINLHRLKMSAAIAAAVDAAIASTGELELEDAQYAKP